MQKLSYDPSKHHGSDGRMPSTMPSASSTKLSPQQLLGAGYARAIFRLCQIPEVDDPKAFLLGAGMILAEYPEAVMKAVSGPAGIPSNFSRPQLADIRAACDAAYAPLERQLKRELPLALSAPDRPATEADKARVSAALERFKRGAPREQVESPR